MLIGAGVFYLLSCHAAFADSLLVSELKKVCLAGPDRQALIAKAKAEGWLPATRTEDPDLDRDIAEAERQTDAKTLARQIFQRRFGVRRLFLDVTEAVSEKEGSYIGCYVSDYAEDDPHILDEMIAWLGNDPQEKGGTQDIAYSAIWSAVKIGPAITAGYRFMSPLMCSRLQCIPGTLLGIRHLKPGLVS
jgi:hypothetical protein